MTPQRYARLREVFHQVCDLDGPRRRQVLEMVCADDLELRREVERLISLEGTPLRVPETAPPVTTGIPERIGRYRILRLIGEGGMGFVYEARQDDPHRRVALKVIRPGLVSGSLLRRFHHEAEVLGRLKHPGIAQIYEAGTTDRGEGGQPFFAMELVEGEPLLEYAQSRDLGIRHRLALVAMICDALHHAHQKGVIHRDLKPANILVEELTKRRGDDVTKAPATGMPPSQPKILDFGVARATGSDVPAVTMQTALGQLVGTVPYMSPEQAAGDPSDVDIRSDVYSLGVITYELLSGRLPHDVSGKLIHEAVRTIRQDDPSRLSSVDRVFRGDVDTIVSKALAREKDRRYQSAAELAADIRRFLAELPITARPASALYQLRKFARRNRALAASIGLAFLAMIAATGVSLWQLRLARIAEAERAVEAAAARRQSYRATIVAASAAIAGGDPASARRSLDLAGEALRNWEWRYFDAALDQSIALIELGEPIAGAALGGGGALVVTVSCGGEITCRDAVPGTLLWSSRLEAPEIGDAAFSADLARVATISGTQRGTVALWETRTGRLVERFAGVDHPLSDVNVSPDGRLVAASLQWDQVGMVWSEEGCDPLWRSVFPGVLDSLRFSRDGRFLAVGHSTGGRPAVRIVDALTGADVQSFLETSSIYCLDLSADLARAAIGTSNKEVVLRELAPGGRIDVLRGHASSVEDVRFTADAARLVSAGATVRLWNVSPPAALATFIGHRSPVRRIELTDDGSRILSLGTDNTVRLWDTAEDDSTAVLRGHESFVYAVDFSPDGLRIVSGAWDGTARIWDAASGDCLGVLPVARSGVTGAAWTPDGRFIVTADLEGDIKVWGADTAGELRCWQGRRSAQATLAVSPDSARLACMRDCLDSEATAHVWSLLDGAELASFSFPARSFTKGDFSPDSRHLAVTAGGGLVRVYDLERRVPVRDLGGNGENFVGIAWSPDGTILAAGDLAGTIRLWSAEDGRELGALHGHVSAVYALCFSPDGTRLASGSNDTTIRLWDVANLEEVAELRGHGGYVYSLAFSPDGARLVSGSGDHTVRIWDTQPRRERWRSRALMRALRTRAEPAVDRLRAGLGDWAAVAARLRAEGALTDREREAALQVTFQRALDDAAAGAEAP